MNKNKKIILSFIFIVLSVVFSFFGFSNLKEIGSSYFNLSRENSSLIEKKNKADEKLKILSQENNSKKSKLDVINSEINKFDIIKEKTSEIDSMNKEISESLILFRKNNFNEFYNTDIRKVSNYKTLKGNFIEDNLTEDDVKSNLTMIQFILNSYYNFDLNRNISKHNLKAYENLGIIDYLINGDNYMLKSILLNDTSKISKLKEEKENILKEEEDFFSIYENIYGNKENIKIPKSDKSGTVEDLKSSEKDEDNNFKILNALCIDILNSSVNYLGNFKIIRENGVNKLNILDNTIMSEENEKNKISITYYNRISGDAYTLTEEKE